MSAYMQSYRYFHDALAIWGEHEISNAFFPRALITEFSLGTKAILLCSEKSMSRILPCCNYKDATNFKGIIL